MADSSDLKKTVVYTFPFMLLFDISAVYHYDEGGFSVIWALILSVPGLFLTLLFMQALIGLIDNSTYNYVHNKRKNELKKMDELRGIQKRIQLLKEQDRQ